MALSPFSSFSSHIFSVGEGDLIADVPAADKSSGLQERRSPYVEAAPIHIICCGLAALVVWLMSSLLQYLTSDYEVQYIKRQTMGVRLCGLVLLLSVVVFFVFPFKSQSLFVNIIRSLATIFAAFWGMFVDEHTVIRWLHLISTVAMLVVDTFCVGLQADLLDCQLEKRCVTEDPDWMLMVSFVRQYIAITFELLAILYALYLFRALGVFKNILLPEDYGVPRHLRELAKATITRKKLEERERGAERQIDGDKKKEVDEERVNGRDREIEEKIDSVRGFYSAGHPQARDPNLFDKGNVHQLFDPKEPLEIKWDAFTDALLGDNRKSWPISKNRRRLSNVSGSEMQRRLRIMAKLRLPIDDYLEMRKDLENERKSTDEFHLSATRKTIEDEDSTFPNQ